MVGCGVVIGRNRRCRQRLVIYDGRGCLALALALALAL
jgi:hypothetical protein